MRNSINRFCRRGVAALALTAAIGTFADGRPEVNLSGQQQWALVLNKDLTVKRLTLT